MVPIRGVEVSRRLDYNNPVDDLDGARLSSYTFLSIEDRMVQMQISTRKQPSNITGLIFAKYS
jgi:hypothetical protein